MSHENFENHVEAILLKDGITENYKGSKDYVNDKMVWV